MTRRPLRGSFGVAVRQMQQQLVANGGTIDPKCECGKEVAVKDWRIHRASCPAVQRKAPEK